ncbi:hypothetical protein [Citricoccus nitrophenolicus]|uniref:hypothetical protein n=1 Tax=Citricoccus nitrophenolicus TaxID=863575 RepID=UPI0031F03E12
MRREDLPQPSASTFKPAQEFIREYKLSQWRTTDYIEAIAHLVRKGYMPNDLTIANYMSDKRTAHGVAKTMESVVKAGLARVIGETERGSEYRLTDKGEQALVRIQQINAEWLRFHESEIDPPAPDYSRAFERLNREIKDLREVVDAKNQIIEFQKQAIRDLEHQLMEG